MANLSRLELRRRRVPLLLRRGTSIYGNVKGNNAFWGNFAGGWNDRADWFRNDGISCNVRIYKDINYNNGSWFPEERLLYRGSSTTWYNFVSSRHWWFPSGASCA